MKQSFFKYYIIIALLVVTNVATLAYFNFSDESRSRDRSGNHKKSYSTKYPLIDPARPTFELVDLVTNVQPLREYLKSLPEANKSWADISIYFEVLNTGSNITVNTDIKIWPASLAKLPIAIASMKKVDKGDWSLKETKFKLLPKDVDTKGSPELMGQIGKEFDLEFLLRQMLLESDNTAFSILNRSLQPEEVIGIGESVGLDRAFMEDSELSAKEYTRFYRTLYLATYLSEENSQYVLNLLKESSFNDFMKAGLPADIPFAHKWGSNIERNVYGDSGIVYLGKRPYMISVLIQGKGSNPVSDRAKAHELLKEISLKSFEYMNDYKINP